MRKIDTLKKNYEFKNVLDRGKFYRGKYITMYCNKNKKQKNIIGIAIGKKLGKATKRNRLKRLIRESYRLQRKELEQGYNLVFLWNKNQVQDCKCQEVQADMRHVFQKAGILK